MPLRSWLNSSDLGQKYGGAANTTIDVYHTWTTVFVIIVHITLQSG